MRALLVALVVGLAALGVMAQTPDAPLEHRLRLLFPDATGFSPKMGNPPHFEAYGPTSGGGTPPPIGYAFYTTELAV